MKIIVVGNFARWLIHFRKPMLVYMLKMGHDVHVTAPGASNLIRRQLKAMGVYYHDIPLRRDGMNPFDQISYFLSLYRLFKVVQPDIFFGYTIKPVIFGSLAARLAGVKSIYAMIEGLGHVFSKKKTGWVEALSSILYRFSLCYCSKVFFLNRDDQQLFLKKHILSNRKKAVLLNGIGVDLEYYAPHPLPEKPVFFMAARLIHEKGIYHYVEAAEFLKKKYPDLVFNVAGWIDENPSAISQQTLDDWVQNGVITYLGNVDDIRCAMAQSSVFVLPSFYREGVPRSILEAMSMGRAVITTDIPGCRETVVDGVNGFLIKPQDTSHLIVAMEKCIACSALVCSMGEKSRRMAVDRFDLNHVNQQLFDHMPEFRHCFS